MIIKLYSKDYFDSFFCNSEKVYEDNTHELEAKLKRNEKSIMNLVEKLALIDNSNTATKFITNKIEELSKENSEIKINIEENKFNRLEQQLNQSTPDIIYNNISNFEKCKTLEEKRLRLKLIFESIYYEPNTKSIEVEFI